MVNISMWSYQLKMIITVKLIFARLTVTTKRKSTVNTQNRWESNHITIEYHYFTKKDHERIVFKKGMK